MSTIGIAELSHRGSELVNRVELEGEEFDLTRQGRPTGVVLTRRSRLRTAPTASVAELRKALGQQALDESALQQRLSEVDAGRDASGDIS